MAEEICPTCKKHRLPPGKEPETGYEDLFCNCAAEGRGAKYDADKLRWDLADFKAIEKYVKIMTFGAKKYAPNNWKTVDNAKERYFAAAMRHFVQWRQGEKIDQDSGMEHLAHVSWNIFALMWLEDEERNKTEESS